MVNPKLGDLVYRAHGMVTRPALSRFHSSIQVSLYTEVYRVIKLTPDGFWIGRGDALSFEGTEFPESLVKEFKERWCGRNTYYVYATEESALAGLVLRKNSHRRHARRRLEEAEAIYAKALDATVALANGASLRDILPELDVFKISDWCR